ncbi:MAG: metallophosphoesterase [Prevotella salivae]|uniref:metallophosphoesterase n=1 Tax=Segatella salivae TaxID=228604 RepID=UPI001CAC5B60|nr:metallophosphoesterase [Segatella salivae]MBF1544126.1 metallophosphoesterase [Segatella salivae]
MNSLMGLMFLVIPLLGCSFVGWHVWMILPFGNVCKAVILGLMILAFLGIFFNFFIGLDGLPTIVARIFYEIGYSSLFILLYLFMLFLLADVARWIGILPREYLHASGVGSLVVLLLIVGIFTYGNLHYYNKVKVPIALKSSKRLKQPVKMVMVSDIHLGYHNTRTDLAKWVDMINAEKPDYVLIAGDIVDFSVVPLLRADMAKEFRRLQAPVFACLGNHDYYAGEPNSEKFYRDAGIKLLRDATIDLGNGITLIGRDDRTNKRRKPLKDLMSGVDRNNYLILLDHQPYHLEDAEQNGVDFQFSGHTHDGQVWPVNWIEKAIYEDSYGPLMKGHTFYYVSSGLGIWGGKFRIGTQSEYCVVTIE